MKNIIIIIILAASVITAQTQTSRISSMPGAFARTGFGARGMGMGNAMSAVTTGNIVSYYNPALSVFQEQSNVQLGYTFLSLDRSLNFLNFTKRFQFVSDKDSIDGNPVIKSTAGISAGVINAGVSNIEERDNQGIKSGDLSTSENQFFLAFANQFSRRVTLGIAVKFYYYSLYDEMSTNSVGIDLGALVRLSEEINLSLMLSDVNAKYKWDSSPVYETEGNSFENKFPLYKKVGLSYSSKQRGLAAGIEWEGSNAGTNYLRFGAEYNIFDALFIRAGLDRWNLSNSEMPVRPSFGFSFARNISTFMASVDYAFVVEPYSSGDKHIIGINFGF